MPIWLIHWTLIFLVNIRAFVSCCSSVRTFEIPFRIEIERKKKHTKTSANSLRIFEHLKTALRIRSCIDAFRSRAYRLSTANGAAVVAPHTSKWMKRILNAVALSRILSAVFITVSMQSRENNHKPIKRTAQRTWSMQQIVRAHSWLSTEK